MIRLDDPWAFRSSRAEPMQAVIVPQGPAPELPGANLEAFAKSLGLPGPSSLAGEEAIINALLGGARERCERYSGFVPKRREYRFQWDLHPVYGSRGRSGVLPSPNELSPWFELPRQPLHEVTEVLFDGEAVEEFEVDNHSNPPRVRVPIQWAMGRGMGSFEIVAQMGPEDADETFSAAVLWLATFLYDNRGCDGGDALKRSGARDLLTPLRVAGGHLL